MVGASARQPGASGIRSGDRASMRREYRSWTLLQLICNCIWLRWFPPRPDPWAVGKRVGLAVPRGGYWRQPTSQEMRHVKNASPPRHVQPPRLVQPCGTIRRADRAGRSPDRRRADARRRRRPDRRPTDRAHVALRAVRHSGRPARRPDLAPLADGECRGAAGGGACRHRPPARPRRAQPAPPGAARLRRCVRHGRLQRGCAGPGALAGEFGPAAGRQCPHRARAHRRLRERAGARWCAGRLVGREPGLRLCRGAFGHRRRTALRNLRAGARADAAAPSVPGHPRRRGIRVPPPAAATGVHHPVHLQHRLVFADRGVRALRRASSRPDRGRGRNCADHVRRRHGDRRAARNPRDEDASLSARLSASAPSPASSPRW